GVACERADAIERAGLVRGVFILLEQAGVRREEIEHLGEAARREAVAAADARTFLEGDRPGEALRGEHLVCDLERLHKTDGTAETVSAHLQEELIGNVVVRADEQLVEN